MGRPAAKELLPHPRTGRPLIQEVLGNVARWNLPATVVVREDKLELIQFLKSWSSAHEKPGVDVLKVPPTQEWPHTVLQSMTHWATFNLLYLPDSEFAPMTIGPHLLAQLATVDCSFAAFDVTDPQNWGMVQTINPSHFKIADKPKDFENGFAWGLIAFRQSVGEALFRTILAANQSGQWEVVDFTHSRLELTAFTDLTRSQ